MFVFIKMSTRSAKGQKIDPNLELNSRVDKMEETLEKGLQELKNQLFNLAGVASGTQGSSSTPQDVNSVLNKLVSFEKTVKQTLANLKIEIERIHLETYSQKQDAFNSQLVFHGVKENNTEDLYKNICDIINNNILKHTDIKITKNDIGFCYRMGKKDTEQKNSRPISVQFVHRWKRDTIYSNKRNLKNLGVVVSEKLVLDKLNLFKKVRAKIGPTSCWTWRGKIFIMGPNGVKKIITSESDLN